jgi:Zn-finger domain-containing protein
MEGLSGAVSVIAVIDISAKIASLCFQYSIAVKDAKNDVERIKKKVSDVKRVLEGVKKLLDGPHKAQLSTTHDLFMSLEQCLQELRGLKSELESSKAMSRFGVRALKWPFTSKQVEKIVSSLEAHKHTFTLAL